MLYEPQLAPPLPDLMLLDEEDPCLSWPRLASFAPAAGSSAPVPIAAPRDAVRCTPPTAASLGSDLVDSMESTQTLLGASLRQEAAASAEQPTMRFVPVEATPAPYPQPYPQPQPLPQLRRSLPSTEWLYGGYGVIAEPQAHPRERATEPSGWAGQEGSGHGMQCEDEAQCYGRQPQPAHAYEQARSYGGGWELPPASLPARHASGYAHAAGASTLSMSFPYSTQLGRHLPAPVSLCVLGYLLSLLCCRHRCRPLQSWRLHVIMRQGLGHGAWVHCPPMQWYHGTIPMPCIACSGPIPTSAHSAASPPLPAVQAHHGFGRTRIHLSEDALQFGNYRGTHLHSGHPDYEPAGSPEPDGMYSEVCRDAAVILAGCMRGLPASGSG